LELRPKAEPVNEDEGEFALDLVPNSSDNEESETENQVKNEKRNEVGQGKHSKPSQTAEKRRSKRAIKKPRWQTPSPSPLDFVEVEHVSGEEDENDLEEATAGESSTKKTNLNSKPGSVSIKRKRTSSGPKLKTSKTAAQAEGAVGGEQGEEIADSLTDLPVSPRRGPGRIRGKAQKWSSVAEFATQAEFNKWLREDGHGKPGLWQRKRSTKVKDGQKQYYGCRIRDCAAELFAFYPAASESVGVSANDKEHLHEDGDTLSRWGMSPAAKLVVQNAVNDGITKPSHIHNLLISQNLDSPNLAKKIGNYLCRWKKLRGLDRKSRDAKAMQIPLAELDVWCKDNALSQAVAALDADQDSVYVIDHAVNSKTGAFHLILSSRALLRFAAGAPTIHVDSTHTLRWFGCPVYLVGVSDARGTFFPILFWVTRAESRESYTQMLKILKRCVGAISGTEFLPSAMVGDGAAALTQAMETVFPDTLRRVCWTQVRRAFVHAARGLGPEARDQCVQDVAKLQLSGSRPEFETAAALLLDKWRRRWPQLVATFRERHLDRNQGWYEGFDLATYSTNRALSGAVTAVRNEHSLREMLPMARFLELSVQMVRRWSVESGRGAGLKMAVTPSQALLRETIELQQQQKTMVHVDNAIYIPSGDRQALSVEEVDEYELKTSGGADSFDELVAARAALHKVVDHGNKTDITQITCTCTTFFRRKICEHVLAIGAAYDLVEMPSSFWDGGYTPEGKKKRGRPFGSVKKPKEAAEEGGGSVCYVELEEALEAVCGEGDYAEG